MPGNCSKSRKDAHSGCSLKRFGTTSAIRRVNVMPPCSARSAKATAASAVDTGDDLVSFMQ